MRLQSLALAAGFLVVTLSGCLEDTSGGSADDTAAPGGDLVDGLLKARSVPLWDHPQTTPHPAFNYPTLTHPPEVITNPWLEPIEPRELPSNIMGMEGLARVEGTSSGAGMSLIGRIAILPSNPTTFVDISNPLAPVVVGSYEAGTRGSDTIVYPDGTIAAVLATGGEDILVLDITDPTNPAELQRIPTSGTHKVDVVPGTPIVYNSAGGEIYDLTNKDSYVEVAAKMPATCHRTYFYIEPAEAYYRAICASYRYTRLWDITDPRNPVTVVDIPMWHAMEELPPISPPEPATVASFSHFAILNDDHTVLAVGDEMGGGILQACAGHVGTPVRDVSTPTGAVWFFDVSDEMNPELRGWISPKAIVDNPTGFSCTAHHGRLVPDPVRDLLAIGFYGAGTVLIDFTDPSAPQIVDQFHGGVDPVEGDVDPTDGGSVWEAWYYNGYIFTGDGNRGLDTIGLV